MIGRAPELSAPGLLPAIHFPDTTLLGHVYEAGISYAPCIQSFTLSRFALWVTNLVSC